MPYRILAQSNETAAALSAWLPTLGQPAVTGDDPRCRVRDTASVVRNGGLDAFHDTCNWLQSAADEAGGGRPVVFVDSVQADRLSAIAGPGWNSLVAMLILAFPDVRWVFGVCVGSAGDERRGEQWRAIHAAHALESLLDKPQHDPLLDPTGLREWVRERTNDELRALGSDLRLPRRGANRLAVAIDEEPAFAYLHAYTAYRFGCRADVIVTWRAMRSRFAATKDAVGHGYWLLLEDMSLNFADREGNIHLLDLRQRAQACPLLDSTLPQEQSTHRILVTTGQSRPGDGVLSANRQYLGEEKRRGKGKIVFKPLRGMFDLWDKIGLLTQKSGSGRRGNVAGFMWPPEPPSESVAAEVERLGHGAPGRLMLVAARLIARAKHLMRAVDSTEEAVRGAVFATDALECTGGRTPTTATDALALKHAFEVLAECQFAGVEYHVSVDQRLDEIRAETAALARWFAAQRRPEAILNAEMAALHGVVGVLREKFKFDEEQRCMNRIRHLHNTIWTRQRPVRMLLLPLLRYLELLLSSFATFVVMLLVWIITLSLLYDFANGYKSMGPGLADAVTSFLSVNPPMSHTLSPEKAPWSVVTVACIAMVSGFVHLGVFVSHLYTLVARR